MHSLQSSASGCPIIAVTDKAYDRQAAATSILTVVILTLPFVACALVYQARLPQQRACFRRLR